MQLYTAETKADEIAGAAENEVLRIQAKYSRYTEDSVLSRINATAGSGHSIKVDAETQSLLNYAAVAHQQSNGLFDITSGVLRRAWDFKSQRPATQSALDALLPLINWSLVQWSGEDIVLPKPGMEIDFGGFGKEYAADRTAAVLRSHGIQHGLVDLAGDIHVIGPHPDGRPWKIGIQHPRQSGAIRRLSVAQGAIASSGDYERGFVHQGRRYSHILNPKTGWPVVGLASVSTLADNCLIAGTASTCAMLHKTKEGLMWLKDLGLPFLAIDQKLRVFENLADNDVVRSNSHAR